MKQRLNLKNKAQQGFTLVELLVVVSVLATMASIAAIAMDGYEQQAQEQLAETEMQRIASAIYRFKEDTGYYPEEGLFADNGSDVDMSWLFTQPVSAGIPILPWNANSSRGWNGPYIELSSQNYVVGNSAICGLDENNFDTGFDTNELVGITDTFERNTEGAETCAAVKYSGDWVRREYTGQAYRYDTDYENNDIAQCLEDTPTPISGNGCVALVSAGDNGVYGDADDLVTVLRAK